ncbi:hypothetical protein OAP83_03000 [Rickettsiales bacterium]|nr:hypothetical protein [Rickettsiales bacterium]
MSKKDFKSKIQKSVNGNDVLDEVLGIEKSTIKVVETPEVKTAPSVAKNENLTPASQPIAAPEVSNLSPIAQSAVPPQEIRPARVKKQTVGVTVTMEYSLHERLRKHSFDTRDFKSVTICKALDNFLRSQGY